MNALKNVILICATLTINGFNVCSQTVHDSILDNCKSQKSYIYDILNRLMQEDLAQYDYNVKDNQTTLSQTIKFLNSDFNTTIFEKFCFLRTSNFWVSYRNTSFQLGIIEVGFVSITDADEAKKIVLTLNRTNFKIKVLTKFKLICKEKNLIFVFSETPEDIIVDTFFERVEEF